MIALFMFLLAFGASAVGAESSRLVLPRPRWRGGVSNGIVPSAGDSYGLRPPGANGAVVEALAQQGMGEL